VRIRMMYRHFIPLIPIVFALAFPACETSVPTGGSSSDEDIMVADFEGRTYGDWTVEGKAFGTGPVRGTLPDQQEVTGYLGRRLVNSYRGGDGSTGTLTSPRFRIQRRYINFLVGGGKYPGKTCINLIVGEEVARTATGPNDMPGGSEELDWHSWDVSELLGKLEGPCKMALKDAGLSTGDVDEILMVGGMTRMPAVQERVRKIFGKEPGKGVNPDEVVAIGAAIQGAVLKGDVKDVLLLDVTPLSLGIETLGGVMTKLIERNTTIPTKKSEVFTTAEDSQPAVTVHVLQGEREMASDNKTLARFELAGLPPAPRGVPQIEVSFDIDANGIVKVSAKDTSTGKEQSIRITASSGLSQEEIKKLVKEAELHASEDSRKRNLADARNSADSLIYTTEKLIKENGDAIDPAFKGEVEGALENLKAATESEDPDEIRRLTEVLTQASHKMSEAMYQKASAAGWGDGHGYDGNAGQQGPPRSDEEVIDADYREVA